MRPAIRLTLLFIIVSGSIFLLQLYSCGNKKRNQNPQYASLSDSVKYVGKEACRPCHSDKYETFMHTGMGLSMDRASKQKSSANYTGHEIIRDKFSDLNYYPHWKDDSLYLLEFRLDGRDTIYKRIENLSWIVGSGQHTNSHLVNLNGYVYQAPATFYTQKKQWDLPPGFENGFNSRFSRAIGLECMTCHNAYPDFVAGSENKYRFVDNGIDCERCHGPGSIHIREKLAGKTVDISSEIDYTIVNPSKLPIDLQMDVCQRCHIQGNAVLQEGKSFLDFRPGMHLSEVMNVYMPVFSGDDDSHIMASHVERLKLSRCFTESLKNAEDANRNKQELRPYVNAMTCVTCHDPHVSVRSMDQSVFNSRCMTCHSSVNDAAHSNVRTKSGCTENPETRLKVNDNCVKCHMPRNSTIDIPHVSTTDHWIRVPVTRQHTDSLKAFVGLACINNPNPGKKSMGIAFLNYYEKFSSNKAYLDSAKKYFDDSVSDSVASNFKYLIRWAFLKEDYAKVTALTEAIPQVNSLLALTSYTNEDAWTAYRIGESYFRRGENEKAHGYFQKAVALAPFQPDFRNKLAGIEQELGRIEEARKNYEFILKENPKYTSAYISLGFLILSNDRNAIKADQMYDKALALDPDNVQAYLNKAGLMLYLGDKVKAKMYLGEVLKREKNNQLAKDLLQRI